MFFPKAHRRRTVIVDDSRTMQAVLEQTLSAKLGCEIVGVAGDGQAAISMIRQLQPDFVTIDLLMPYIGGKQLLQELAVFPNMYKIVISTSACSNLSIRAELENMGADACICKKDLSLDPDGFIRKLSTVLRGPKKLAVKKPVPLIVSPRGTTLYPVPADEHERLAALKTLCLANDDTDFRLDLLTEHLAKTTGYAASVITFIDRDTQWVKSGYGLERGSVSRSQAVCNYTICGDEPFIVHDLLEDSRFCDLDAVRSGPMIRSYVGYPIVGSAGVRLGAVCLLDTKPRRVVLKELTNLRSIARIAAQWLEDRAIPIRHAA